MMDNNYLHLVTRFFIRAKQEFEDWRQLANWRQTRASQRAPLSLINQDDLSLPIYVVL